MPESSRIVYVRNGMWTSLLDRPPAEAVAAILALDRGELAARRRRLEVVRKRFVYDWSGQSQATLTVPERTETGR
eukprot:2539725-Prymnesium_polylepis.1